ncbi:MAG: hypothetical protein AB1714_18640 [Acidobacteriota bacterium]
MSRRMLLPCCLILLLTWAVAPLQAAKKPHVMLDKDSYSPHLSGNLEGYKNKEVFLADFENEAEDTRIWYYYSPDKNTTYEASPTIQSYLWYCWEKALWKLDLRRVYRDSSPSGDIPELRLVFTSWSDRNFVGTVTIWKKAAVVFAKTFDVKFDEPSPAETAQLEQRAYRQMNGIISTILGDDGVRKVLEAQ